jgi:predicted  nucleic acid-binding Zn-ribbon protein
MDVPEPESVISTLGDLRRELQGELEGLKEKRSRLEGELQALSKEIEAKQCELELVAATEREMTAQGREQPDDEDSAPGESTQVRGSAERPHGTSPQPVY